jgi:glutaminase
MEANCKKIAVMAATLANAGTNPLTGEKIFDEENVNHCLSLMKSCGMYDFSGEWSYRVGLPGKSGVSGCVFLIIP